MLTFLKLGRTGLLLLLFLLSTSYALAGNKDSLLNAIQTTKDDSSAILTFRELAYYHLFEDYDVEEAQAFIEQGIDLGIASQQHFLTGKMYALRGYVEQFYVNDYAHSVASYYSALDQYDLADNEPEKFAIYLNLGNLYHSYEQYEDAVKFSIKAYELAEKTNILEDWALAKMNLGTIYSEMGEEASALECFEEAKEHYVEQQDSINIAILDFSIANIIFSKDDISTQERLQAIETYHRVRKVFIENQMTEFYLGAIVNLGSQLTRIESYEEAEKYLEEGKELATEMNNFRLLIDVFANLAENAEKQGQYEEQVEHLKKMQNYNDSLFNESKAKAISEVEIKYETDKINAQNELLQKESEIQEADLARSRAEARAQEQQKTYLFIGLGFVVLFAMFIFNRFRITTRQKKTIEDQKSTLEVTHNSLAEKNKEIMDSIHYAKRIQVAVLPSVSRIARLLPNAFILYKPKDIVAGDFYWLEERDGKILYAAADCTGHGVPGAMVSVICNNGLNRSVRERGLVEPGKILDHTREIVVKEFEKSEEEVKDGMDISLCAVDLDSKTMRWAGANNPLWIIRNGEIIVHKGDSQPIGKHYDPKPFKTHEIALEDGDLLYMFTDGYADQFGGEKGKKMMSKRFKALLLDIHLLELSEQKSRLDEYFEEWRRNEEQIDDVCVIGFKV